jgi:hypothetical protein
MISAARPKNREVTLRGVLSTASTRPCVTVIATGEAEEFQSSQSEVASKRITEPGHGQSLETKDHDQKH